MKNDFGRFVRLERERLGKSMKDLAGLLGVSIVRVSDIELGHEPPPNSENVGRIAGFLGYPVRRLEELAAASRGYVSLEISGRTDAVRRLAVRLGEAWDEMDDVMALEILEVIGENPGRIPLRKQDA